MTQRRHYIPPPPPPVLTQLGRNGGCGGMVSILVIGFFVLWYLLPF